MWKAKAKKRILFLADRNILVDQTMQQDFAPFGEVMHKVTNREIKKNYEIYLALYQAVTGKEEWKQIYRQFPADFFDLIVVDECHRGSAADDSAWREVLEYFGSAVEFVYCANFDEVFHATTSGTSQFGVVGVENSTEGVVTRSLDLFLHSPVHVVAEVSMMVRHHLLRRDNSLEDIEAVLAHPQALAQCQDWLSRYLPNVERRSVSSNAEGARLAASNTAWACLASDRAATQWGLHIVGHAIQDDASNRTRFAVICLPETMSAPDATSHDCTSLVVSVPNRPGAVHDLLMPLKNHGVSMTRFESRPARTGQWDYYFYIDLDGHPSEPHMQRALSELQHLCAFYKVLGTYPVAR